MKMRNAPSAPKKASRPKTEKKRAATKIAIKAAGTKPAAAPAKVRAVRVAATPPAKPEPTEVVLARALAETMTAHGLCEIRYSTEALDLTLRRPGADNPVYDAAPAPRAAAPAAVVLPAPAAAPLSVTAPRPVDDGALMVSSPFVGTFYRLPGPNSPPYAEVGDTVRKGQVLCIVEAMKLMNEIEAEVQGTIIACLVENGQPVEYGQALFKIAPAAA